MAFSLTLRGDLALVSPMKCEKSSVCLRRNSNFLEGSEEEDAAPAPPAFDTLELGSSLKVTKKTISVYNVDISGVIHTLLTNAMAKLNASEVEAVYVPP